MADEEDVPLDLDDVDLAEPLLDGVPPLGAERFDVEPEVAAVALLPPLLRELLPAVPPPELRVDVDWARVPDAAPPPDEAPFAPPEDDFEPAPVDGLELVVEDLELLADELFLEVPDVDLDPDEPAFEPELLAEPEPDPDALDAEEPEDLPVLLPPPLVEDRFADFATAVAVPTAAPVTAP